MNATPMRPEREELARLVPGPVERDLPGDRHQRLQEFVMSRIHQDLQSAGQTPRRASKRRPAILASALTAVAAATAITFVAVGHDGRPAGPSPTSRSTAGPGSLPLSGKKMSTRQMLLAAATSAARQPATDGAYWRVRVLRRTMHDQEILEDWYGKDGSFWGGALPLNSAGGKEGRPGIYRDKKKSSRPFEVADHKFTLAQIRGLPTTKEGIEKWADRIARRVSPEWRQKDIDGYTDDLLAQLLAEAPAPPTARAAAFRALAGRPGVKSAGRTKDEEGREGYALVIGNFKYLVDPSSATLLSRTLIGPKQVEMKRVGTTYLKVGWTNETPRPPARP